MVKVISVVFLIQLMARYDKAGDVEAILSDRDESDSGMYAVRHARFGITVLVHVNPDQYSELEQIFDENEALRQSMKLSRRNPRGQ